MGAFSTPSPCPTLKQSNLPLSTTFPTATLLHTSSPSCDKFRLWLHWVENDTTQSGVVVASVSSAPSTKASSYNCPENVVLTATAPVGAVDWIRYLLITTHFSSHRPGVDESHLLEAFSRCAAFGYWQQKKEYVLTLTTLVRRPSRGWRAQHEHKQSEHNSYGSFVWVGAA